METISYPLFRVDDLPSVKYLFFTGKGGVGKTSLACSVAVTLADAGQRVLLISTDPASNLQDVFSMKLSSEPTPVVGLTGLDAVNIDPVAAAAAYRERTVAPYRGLLPDAAIRDMEEQLSGSCTVEIAAFDEFASFLTDEKRAAAYDRILFDTAPTGHTLRLLQLPSAWEGFLETNKDGASCLGQLSGLGEKRAQYQAAVEHLQGPSTAMILVARPDDTPLKEAARASDELMALGVSRQMLVLNAVLPETAAVDAVTKAIFAKQQAALRTSPQELADLPTYAVPFRSYNITSIDAMRSMLQNAPTTTFATNKQQTIFAGGMLHQTNLRDLARTLRAQGKRIFFTMGKGGVGKTTVAAAVAQALAETGSRILLATTDPAAHLRYVIEENDRLAIRSIDPVAELARYRAEVLAKARATGAAQADIDYIEEDLRSPCTQEIAVFRAFADIVAEADDAIVVIDTAPTGHALLLLDSAQSYHREVERSEHGDIPASVRALLPRAAAAPAQRRDGRAHPYARRDDARGRVLAPRAGPFPRWRPRRRVDHQPLVRAHRHGEPADRSKSRDGAPVDTAGRRAPSDPSHRPPSMAARTSRRRGAREIAGVTFRDSCCNGSGTLSSSCRSGCHVLGVNTSIYLNASN